MNKSTGTGVSVPVSGTGKINFLVSVSESVPALFLVPGHPYLIVLMISLIRLPSVISLK